MRQTSGGIPDSAPDVGPHRRGATARAAALLASAVLVTLVIPHAIRPASAEVDNAAPPLNDSAAGDTAPATTDDQPACTGNCDGQDGVTSADLVTMLGVALGTADLSTSCPTGDRVAPSGAVTVDEIVSAVTFAVTGCPEVTLYCRTPALAIPDDNEFGIFDQIAIPDDVPVTKLRVQLRITHPYVGDLAVELYHVRGEEISVALLLFPPGSCGGQNVDCTLDDAAAALADDQCTDGTPAISGTLRPTDPLSTFAGQSSSGTWELVVYDLLAEDIGTFDSWCLEVQ